MDDIKSLQITIATLYLPYPDVPHGGGQDLFHLIRVLAERHTIRVISFVDAAQAVHVESLLPFVDDVHLVWPAVSWRQKWQQGLAALRRGSRRGLGCRADAEMRRVIGRWPADVLHCTWTQMGRYLTAARPHMVRVLDEVDVRFLVEEAAGGIGLQIARRKQQELAYCRNADLVLTRSARDQRVLQQAMPGLKSLVLPPVTQGAALAAILPEASVPGRVLFVGNMSRRRNQTAVIWLTQAIWPIIQAANPEATLHIVGADPPPHLAALSQKPGITVTGWVANLAEEYAEARVVVAPMRSEAGALNKVLDGLAAGRPVVATTAANAGIAAPPSAIQLADEAVPFARAVIGLLQSKAVWQQQGEAGRRFVQAHFDWHTAVKQYEQVLLDYVGRGSK